MLPIDAGAPPLLMLEPLVLPTDPEPLADPPDAMPPVVPIEAPPEAPARAEPPPLVFCDLDDFEVEVEVDFFAEPPDCAVPDP